MSVEITPPPGEAPRVARELLAVAEAHPDFTINDVATSTSGPMGLAFVVPEAIAEAWATANAEAAPEPEAAPRRRRAPAAPAAPKEED